MKFCTNCGAQIGDGKFCTKCGAPVSNEQQRTDNFTMYNRSMDQQWADDFRMYDKKPKKGKGGLILIIILLVIAAAAAAVFGFVFNRQEQSQSQVQCTDYEEAIDIYVSSMFNGDIDTAVSLTDLTMLGIEVETNFAANETLHKEMSAMTVLSYKYGIISELYDDYAADPSGISYTYEVTEDITEEELQETKELEDFKTYCGDIDLQDAKLLEVEFSADVDGENETTSFGFAAVKIGEYWYLCPMEA